MKLLAWDTSSQVEALVAMEWGDVGVGSGANAAQSSGPRLIVEWSLDVRATHSERLLWAINECLDAARWKLDDINLFGVGVGPGSFTGLRIGLTTARTLAHTLKKPLIGVSSLAALARPAACWLASSPQLKKQKNRAIVIATTDACKGELYALWGGAAAVMDCVAFSEGDRQGLWKRGVREAVLTPAELIVAVKRKLSEGGREEATHTYWIAVGEGRERYKDLWKLLPGKRELKIQAAFPNNIQGRYLGLLVWEAFQAGLGRVESLEVHPRYLRASNAELKLKL